MAKKIFLALVLLFACTTIVRAEEPVVSKTKWSFEAQTLCTTDGCKPMLDVYATFQPARGRIGAYGWVLVTPKWAEAYGGATFALTNWSQVALGAGFEQASMPLRLNASAAMWNRYGSAFATVEWGGSGFWYHSQILANTPLTWLKVGVMSRAGAGSGLRFQLTPGRFTFWLAPLVSHDDPSLRVLGGAKITF
ncbi:MAG: hypothetical protein HYV32_01625 [Candidatus Kerfeldbacteria bacterium]|nr:hypothetical protein [Candidatus Kerfeldbacteria bacterium]